MKARAAFGRRAKKVAAGIGLAAVFSVGGMGFLHTKWGKPLLMKVGGCPVGKASPAELDALRDNANAASRGATPAPARPAFGFDLDKTTLADAKAWAKRVGASCEDKREGSVYVCSNVKSEWLTQSMGGSGVITELEFGFRANHGTMYTVVSRKYGLTPAQGAAQYDAVAKGVSARFGAPTIQGGTASPEFLGANPWATVMYEYRYSDYFVTGSAVNATEGVMVIEQYTSAATST